VATIVSTTIGVRHRNAANGSNLSFFGIRRPNLARHVHPMTATEEVSMADQRNPTDRDGILDPEDVNSQPSGETRDASAPDPNDEVPVPVAMSPAEVDERAQAVEALRDATQSRSVDDPAADDQRMRP